MLQNTFTSICPFSDYNCPSTWPVIPSSVHQKIVKNSRRPKNNCSVIPLEWLQWYQLPLPNTHSRISSSFCPSWHNNCLIPIVYQCFVFLLHLPSLVGQMPFIPSITQLNSPDQRIPSSTTALAHTVCDDVISSSSSTSIGQTEKRETELHPETSDQWTSFGTWIDSLW